MTRVPTTPEPWIQILKDFNKGSKESWHAIYDSKDLMVKMGKLVREFKNRSFRDEFHEKMVEQITSPKSIRNYAQIKPWSLRAVSYPATEPGN
jgi:hypothetical protein